MQGPNPAIAGEAIRKAVGTDGAAPSTAQAAREWQAALDRAELRELERSQYDRLASGAVVSPQAPAPRRRNLLDRLLRR